MLEALKLFAALFGLVCLVAACATRPPAPEVAGPIVIERDLTGRSTAQGQFRAITGARRNFTAELNGSWDGRVLTLVEDFAFDDGERDRKTWRLERLSNGEWRGTREDVVGYARGFSDGAVFRLEYDVVLDGRRVRFRDVLALQAGGVILNTATVGWLGLSVGSVSLIIERQPAAAL